MFVQATTLTGMHWQDAAGRRVEVIRLDRDGRGARQWIRVSWHHRILLGRGYYRLAELDAVLALVDTEGLVEVIDHPASALWTVEPHPLTVR